jgi:hypothetical protein
MSTAAPPSHDDTKVDRLGDLTTFGGSSRAARGGAGGSGLLSSSSGEGALAVYLLKDRHNNL